MEDKNRQSQAPHAAERINIDAISQLVKLMADNDLVEIEYAVGDLSIRLNKRSAPPAAPAAVQAPVAAPVGGHAAHAGQLASGPQQVLEEKRYLEIVSPMVGTFYLSSGPDAQPYAVVGTTVTDDSVICLIEAMKVFNEIKAGVSGKVVKVCVENEDPVEFGQVLFLVDPGAS